MGFYAEYINAWLKRTSVSLDQWFSKRGPGPSGISITWGHVGNANDRTPARHQKLWGWSPAVCVPVRLPGTADARLTWRPLLCPAQSSKLRKTGQTCE